MAESRLILVTDPILPRIRPAIAALAPYRQGKQAGPDAYKLSSNENPFEPLPSVAAALQHTTPINRYPDATAGRLRERLGFATRSLPSRCTSPRAASRSSTS